jgi:hypothetical protein
MAANIGSIGACGFLIRARQSCLPPQYTPSRFRVGGWHAADVPIVVKGTRPPMKVRMCLGGVLMRFTRKRGHNDGSLTATDHSSSNRTA